MCASLLQSDDAGASEFQEDIVLSDSSSSSSSDNEGNSDSGSEAGGNAVRESAVNGSGSGVRSGKPGQRPRKGRDSSTGPVDGTGSKGNRRATAVALRTAALGRAGIDFDFDDSRVPQPAIAAEE